MTYKEFRQLCERAEYERPEPEPEQLKALVDIIDEMLKRRDREKSTLGSAMRPALTGLRWYGSGALAGHNTQSGCAPSVQAC